MTAAPHDEIMRRLIGPLFVTSLLLFGAPLLGAQVPRIPQASNAVYQYGPMGRLGDCIGDGMIAGAAVGLVYGMFQAEASDTRLASSLLWGLIGVGAGVWTGMGYWVVHEIRRDRALRRERPSTVTTPGPHVQAAILRKRPCRGALPFTSGPSEPAAARESGALPWVRQPY